MGTQQRRNSGLILRQVEPARGLEQERTLMEEAPLDREEGS